MRLIRIFSLTALAAVAAMAFLGASSASAEDTSLCKEASALACPAGQQASHVHFFSKKEETHLLNSTLNVLCNALFLGDTVGGNLGNPLVLSGQFTYTNCTAFCTATEENGPTTIETLKTAAGLADVTGEGLVKVNCFGFFTCAYEGKDLLGHGSGAGHTTFTKVKVLAEPEQTKCPPEAFLDALFVSLEPLYIRS